MDIEIILLAVFGLISCIWLWSKWRQEMKRRHYLELKLMECRQQQQKG